MGFKITLIVLCVLLSCICLVESKSDKKHDKVKKGHSHKNREHNERNSPEKTKIAEEDCLQVARYARRATHRQAGNGTDVEESGGFNLDFNKIPGGRGVTMIYDGLKNMFMAINKVLDFGFIWDGVSGIISLFDIRTGATFVINAVSKMGGFMGYMLTDVKEFISAIASGAKMIGASALKLIQSAARFAYNNVSNLFVNMLDFAYALIGYAKQNLEDILGPIFKVVTTVFKPLLEVVKTLAKSVGNGLMILLQPILGAIRAVSAPIVNVLSAVIRTAGGIFDGGLFSAIFKGIGEVVKITRGIVVGVIGGVANGINGIAGGILGTLSGAINGVGSVFNNIRDAIGSIFVKRESEKFTTGYTNIQTTTIANEEPIQFTYANNSKEYFQHFIKEGHAPADVVVLYNAGKKENFISFYNRLSNTVFILSGNKGHVGIFDIESGAGVYLKPNSTKGYAIQPPAFLRADFIGPNAKDVSAAITKLSEAIDKLSDDFEETVDMVVIDVVEVMRTFTLKNALSSILTGEALVVVSRLLGNLFRNLTAFMPPIIRPILGVANTLFPFLLNLPENLINGIISLIGSVVKRFLGLFTPDFAAELAKMVVIAALKGITTPLLAPLLTPLGGISTALTAALLAANTAMDLLNLP